MVLSSFDQGCLDIVACYGIDYMELCRFHEDHYEHTNIFAVEGVEYDGLERWFNSVEACEVERLSPWEGLISVVDNDEVGPCMGLGLSYEGCNLNYVDSPDGLVVHDCGDSYTFTSEERNQQYASLPFAGRPPVHIENLLNAC